ncbi:hypothetical protein ACQ4WX_29685 [Streptomyces lasalocidi]
MPSTVRATVDTVPVSVDTVRFTAGTDSVTVDTVSVTVDTVPVTVDTTPCTPRAPCTSCAAVPESDDVVPGCDDVRGSTDVTGTADVTDVAVPRTTAPSAACACSPKTNPSANNPPTSSASWSARRPAAVRSTRTVVPRRAAEKVKETNVLGSAWQGLHRSFTAPPSPRKPRVTDG